MTFTVLDCPQRSRDWHQARVGRLCGSYASDMLAAIKSGEAAARRDLRLRLVVERLTGQPQEDGYINAAMARGIDLEPAALAAYEAIVGDIAERTGFLSCNEILAGCSLDGHVGDFETVVSIKCPKSATHLRYLRAGGMPSDYIPQMLHELWVTGAQAYDFLSFDDRFPAELQTFYVRTLRNEASVGAYETKALAFLAEVHTEHEAVLTMLDMRGQFQKSIEVTA